MGKRDKITAYSHLVSTWDYQALTRAVRLQCSHFRLYRLFEFVLSTLKNAFRVVWMKETRVMFPDQISSNYAKSPDQTLNETKNTKIRVRFHENILGQSLVLDSPRKTKWRFTAKKLWTRNIITLFIYTGMLFKVFNLVLI